MGKTMYSWRPGPKQRDNSAADKLLIKVRGDSGHPKYPCEVQVPGQADMFENQVCFDFKSFALFYLKYFNKFYVILWVD